MFKTSIDMAENVKIIAQSVEKANSVHRAFSIGSREMELKNISAI